MPKKSIKQVKDSGTTRRQQVDEKKKSLSTIKNVHNKIHIDVKNSKRWLSLKKKLKYLTDDDFVVHLLDLAEANLRQDELSSSKISKEDNEDKNQVEKVEKNQLELDGPRRRSPRKQVVSISPEALKETIDESQKLLEENQTDHVKQKSKIKHHKNRTKHHKEKRKKHRSSKNPDSETSSTLEDKKSDKLSKEIIENVDKTVDLLKMINEKKTEETILDSVVEKNKIQDSNVALTSSMNSKENICQNLPINDEQIDKNLIMQDDSTSLKNISPSITVLKHGTDILNIASTSPGKLNPKVNIKDSGNSEEISSDDNRSLSEIPVNYPESDDKKRTKKRKNMANKTKMSVDKNVEENDDESSHKHKKKKHKHNDNKNKKIHDVRKAPQDGLIPLEQREAISNGFPPDLPDHPVLPLSNTEFDGSLPDHQRLAIKIKLCQDCNSRHVQDACPLLSANYEIFDAITYEDWLKKHKNNQELTKALATNNPMSEGYEKYQDDGFESEEDDTNQYKTTKLKSPNEDKKLQIDYDKPLFSRESLPNCFELKLTNSDHGIGIYAKNTVPIYSKLGPLIGSVVKEMDIPDDFSMRHIWEIDNNGKTIYLSTTDPIKSNWLRYMRPAETKDERNVAVIINNDKLYFITSQNINTGCELLYWVDSQLSVWTRKNKTDKTNCGGCNINFLHPFYYRLHCCIFHDTNYSLTIRKYHCKVCGSAVLGKDNIMKHAAELHSGRGAYQCQYCKKFFLRLNYLEMHRTYGCSQNPQRSRPLCDFCGRKFCQPQKLKVHIKRMHSDMADVLREFQCKLCLKLLGSRAALQRHMKEVHHKDVVAAATCDRCGKMFQNKSNLKIHMLTHSGVKPFKCKEKGCKAAFTTKQCLQFHYKKVHGLSEDLMPKIERSVAYTFDAYSGGPLDDNEIDKSPDSVKRNSQENCGNSVSLDESSSDNDVTPDTQVAVHQFSANDQETKLSPQHHHHQDHRALIIQDSPRPEPIHQQIQLETNQQQSLPRDQEIYGPTRLQSKGSKKWMGEFTPSASTKLTDHSHQVTLSQSDIYEFDDSNKKEEDCPSPLPTPSTLLDDQKLSLSVYRRTESTNASLLVEAALDAAERDIGAVSSPILDDNDRDGNIYSISNQLHSPLPSRSPDSHLDFHIQQQDDLMSPVATPDGRVTPPSHLHSDYHLHRTVDYINSTRTHNIEQYLHHDDLPRSSSPTNNYIHMPQDDLDSPSATPNPRYQDIHHQHHHQQQQQQQQHQRQNDNNLSSDEGDSVAQNLSISVKEKSLQLDLSTSYKYEQLDLEFSNRERNFEPLILNNGELQGLDMSARSFHSFSSSRYPPPPPPHHHHHHQHYEIDERQSVDLSRTGSYSPPPYPHGDVLRVGSLDLTPGRHSVDLSLGRSHHIHPGGGGGGGVGSGPGVVAGTGRIITSPPSPGSIVPHVVDENIDGRMLSPSPLPSSAPLPAYNPAYPVSPAAYHPSRSGYHHYSGYY